MASISLRCAVLLSTLLAALLSALPAHAFVDPPTFSPPQPWAEQTVEMTVRAGVCHAFTADAPPGYEFVEVVVDGNLIDVIITGVAEEDFIWCNIPIHQVTVEIGGFPAGEYLVRVRIRLGSPPFEATPPVAQAPLIVQTLPTPHAVPTLGPGGMLVLLLVVLGVAMGRGRSIGGWALMIGTLGWAPSMQAQEMPKRLLVEIAAEPGAPSPEMVVEGYDFSGGLPPPLTGLTTENPQRAAYLIQHPFRARGGVLAYLENNPDLPRARLERTLIVIYPDDADLDLALAALAQDPDVRHVEVPGEIDFSVPPGSRQALSKNAPLGGGDASQYWIDAMNFPGAWSRAGGWTQVGIVDNGLAVDHPDLRAFDDFGNLTGGNFLPVYAFDIGRQGISDDNPIDFNVDEREPVAAITPTQQLCDPENTGFMVADWAGHGTHVSGLVAANHSNPSGVVGACKRCGLASFRVAYERCQTAFIPPQVRPQVNSDALWESLIILTDIGVPVINMSNGGAFLHDQNYCVNVPNHVACQAIAYAHSHGVMIVAASGNRREGINFPARDPRVVSVGGLDEGLDFWDESPGNTANCPLAGSMDENAECGSNFTQNALTDAAQEQTTPARRVLSTFYPGAAWNPDIGCSDDTFGVDGQGSCTGTSMSAPLTAGAAGILRSINPLLLPGDGAPGGPERGIRSVMAEHMLSPFPENWDPRFGYGSPDVGAAAAALLGVSDGKPVKNRATPLFALYSTITQDWAYVTVPQAALALIRNEVGLYQPQGALTPGYLSFPTQAPAPPPPSPRASAYVLTTEFKVDPAHPNLRPLYWLDRARPWPLGCTPGVLGCNGDNRDFLLMSSDADVAYAVNDGYNYRGLQGYLYQICAPEPACVPEGAERLWLKCKSSEDDCAVFLEAERVAFEAQGYTEAYPPGSNMLLGYAYPNIDSDGDGLIDGFEYLLGTDPNQVDSDADGLPDGVEYPPAGIPLSDPCSYGRCREGYLFADGFEPGFY